MSGRRYRKAHGYTPIAEDILDAIERNLVPYQSWAEVPAPMFRVRGEPLPVQRMLVTVRNKRFKVYVVSAQTPGVVGIAAICHPGRRRIER